MTPELMPEVINQGSSYNLVNIMNPLNPKEDLKALWMFLL
jgi:hypothetical protein